MDPELEVAGAFIFDTPPYGIATAIPTRRLPTTITLSSHRATEHLVQPLLQRTGLALRGEVQYCSSTSKAAQIVAEEHVDAALTNSASAALFGLTFISPTMPIRMVSSVFSARHTTHPLIAPAAGDSTSHGS